MVWIQIGTDLSPNCLQRLSADKKDAASKGRSILKEQLVYLSGDNFLE